MNPLLLKFIKNIAFFLPFFKRSPVEESAPPVPARKTPDTSKLTAREIAYVVHKFESKPSFMTQQELTDIINFGLNKHKSRTTYARLYKRYKESLQNQEM